MSGITGFYLQNEKGKLQIAIKNMLATVQHRGKYHQSIYTDFHPFYIAHASSEVSSNNNEINISGNKYLFFLDGYISNLKQIKDSLAIPSDDISIIILNAYLKYGKKVFEKLIGKFAIVIYDHSQQEIILARDYLGQKPLYYTQKKGFAFSSELNAFKEVLGELQLSMQGMNEFLSIGYTLQPHTIYEDIFIIPPASYLVYNISSHLVQIVEYEQIGHYYANKHQDKYADILQNVNAIFQNSCNNYPQADNKLAVFLSSGLDSCAVLSAIHKNKNNNILAHTISYGKSKYDESILAQKIAQHYNVQHQIIDLSQIDKEDFDRYLQTTDYVNFDNSSYPIYLLSRVASQNVNLALTGDGGDELFGGYTTYKADTINQIIKPIIPLIKNSIFQKSILKITSNKNDKLGFATKMNRFLNGIDTDIQKAHYQWKLIFNPQQRISLLGEKYKELIYDTDPFYKFQRIYHQVPHLEQKDQHIYVDMKTWFADNNLIKLDRSTMAYSLETYAPFLDKDLFKYVAACPSKYKNNKQILKDVLKNTLPNYIIKRKKSGFNSPVHQWFDIQEDEFEYYTQLLYFRKYTL